MNVEIAIAYKETRAKKYMLLYTQNYLYMITIPYFCHQKTNLQQKNKKVCEIKFYSNLSKNVT